MSGTLPRRIAVIVALALYASLAFSSMGRHSATWDETHYLGLGAVLLKEGRWDLPSATLHPPLSYYLHSLPLLFCKLDAGCFEKGRSSDILAGVRRGQCLMSNSTPSGDSLLSLARLPMIGIGVLLGWIVYLWASALFGAGGGLLSLFLYCLNPEILAHSGLITPDLCLAAFGFMAVYFSWRSAASPSTSNVVLAGLALGLTLLSKHSGLLWLPVMAALAFWQVLRVSSSPVAGRGSALAGALLQYGVIVGIGFLVLWAGYGFDIAPYFSGMDAQRQIVGRGLPAFLNGSVSQHGGWWYYYLFAFAVKAPIPLLILLAIVWFHGGKRGSERRAGILWLALPVLGLFAAFSFFTKVNIGLRYVLGAFPFLMVWAGGAYPLLARGGAAGRVALTVVLAWYAWENGAIYPHYHSYFNQFAGGPQEGYRRLVDSNLDWGQDLKGLKAYMDKEGIARIKFSYFGTADPARYGIRYERLPSFFLPENGPSCNRILKGDLVAVSATNLYPLYVDLGPLAGYLRGSPPLAQVGHSILIYRMEEDF